MSNKNIEIFKGTTLAFALEFEGITQQLESIYFTVKRDLDSDEPIIQKSLNDGISVVDILDNSISYRVRVAPADTSNIEVGNYYYDLQISINGDVFTILNGKLKIKQDVTTNN